MIFVGVPLNNRLLGEVVAVSRCFVQELVAVVVACDVTLCWLMTD